MSCCGGTNGTVVSNGRFSGSVFRYNNEDCGVTIERIQEIDRGVLEEYKKTRSPYLLSLNTELRRIIGAYNRIDLCEMLTQIEDWEKTYVIR